MSLKRHRLSITDQSSGLHFFTGAWRKEELVCAGWRDQCRVHHAGRSNREERQWPYICVLHDDLGMKGKVIVLP